MAICVWRFDREREVADRVVLRGLELAVVHALALNARELLDDDPQRLGRVGGLRVGLGDDRARIL